MESQLNSLMEQYEKIISRSQYDSYASKLRRFLTPYIIDNFKYINDVAKIFKDEFTPHHIIMSTVYYMKECQNVKSYESIRTYLIAITSFFNRIIIKEYPDANARKYMPFARYYDDVKNKLIEDGYKDFINYKESDPVISPEQFIYIMNFLKTYDKGTTKSNLVKIIIRLFLLYGFSQRKLSNFKRENFDGQRRLLRVDIENKRKIELELPYNLASEINEYMQFRIDNSPYLFVNEKAKQINSGFLVQILKEIKNGYEANIDINEVDDRNQFTPTGMQKYAIVKMIENHMDQSIILEFTGQGPDIYDYCWEQVNQKIDFNHRRYINHVIRGIETYDFYDKD